MSRVANSSENPFSGELPRTVRLRNGQFAEVLSLLEPTDDLPYALLGRLRDRTYLAWTCDGAYEPGKISREDILGEVMPDGSLVHLRKAGGKGQT